MDEQMPKTGDFIAFDKGEALSSNTYSMGNQAHYQTNFIPVGYHPYRAERPSRRRGRGGRDFRSFKNFRGQQHQNYSHRFQSDSNWTNRQHHNWSHGQFDTDDQSQKVVDIQQYFKPSMLADPWADLMQQQQHTASQQTSNASHSRQEITRKDC